MEIQEGQIKLWKQKHGKVFEIVVKDKDKEYKGYFKKPGIDILSAASKYVTDDPIKSSRIIYENCKLAIDPEVETNEELQLSMMLACNQLFQIKLAEVKEL